MSALLKIVVLDAEDDAPAAFAELAATVERVCPVALEPVTASSYPAMLELARATPHSLVWAPPLVAHELVADHGAAPLVVAARRGCSAYYSALVSLAEGPRVGLEGLEGARIGWVSRLSVAGYGLPRMYLRSLGLDPDSLFREQVMLSSHEAVAAALRDGRIDVGATYAHLGPDRRRVQVGARLTGVRVLAMAGPIPADTIVAGAGVAEGLRVRLRRAMLSLAMPESGVLARRMQLERFDPVPPGHLDPIRRWARRAEEVSSRPLAAAR